MMVKINERFSIERDKYQWVLVEHKNGTSKKGEAIKTEARSYYPKLEQICNEIVEREAGDCATVKEIIVSLKLGQEYAKTILEVVK